MKRSILLLAVILCGLTILPAKLAASADSWVSVRSKNFLLVGNTTEKEIRKVALKLEQFHEVFSRLFSQAKHSSPVPTTVVVFKNDKSYAPFKPLPNTAGYFQPGPDVNYITLTTELGGEQDPFTVIFHEYTHLLVNNTSGNVPTWFNEGLAEYYSTLSITDDQKVALGKPIGSHVYLLRQKKLLPLKTLLEVDHKSPYYNERDKQSMFYAQSWALMHYLILGKGGERINQIGKFVELTSANVPLEQAFQQAFAMSFEELEKELKAYIRNDRYPIISVNFERKIGFDTEMEAAPITEAEAQAYLGDLLLHSNRADSEGYLEKALALDPNLAMAHASMGMLRVRQGRAKEARQSLERAVAANSQNYLARYYYAFALSREGRDGSELTGQFSRGNLQKIRAELKKAIELRPDFPESYGLLAYVSLVDGTELDESVQMLKRALAASPGRSDLVFMLAQVYMLKEDYQTSRDLFARLSENNRDLKLRQRAQVMLAEIVSMQERMPQFRATRQNGSRNQPGLQDSMTSADESGVPPNADASSILREALRKPGAGETLVHGVLARVECASKAITFVVKVGERLLKLNTPSFEQVNLTSYSVEAGREITCGPRKPENNVVIVYRPAPDGRAKVDGIPISIEFVPSDFKLIP